ncbi:MAG: hypothetical protein MI866_23660 [Bacteroidales bacterium]|nr:hypothetical protein [Bacteroidales bacterium]
MKLLLLGLLLFETMGQLIAQPKVSKKPQRLISLDEEICMRAEWSPDGQSIAFTSEKNKGLRICDEKGRNVRDLTNDANAGFGYWWSYNSKSILAKSISEINGERVHQVVLYDVDDNSKVVLLDGENKRVGLPQWTEGGATVVVPVNGALQHLKSGMPALKGSQPRHAICVNGTVMLSPKEQFEVKEQFNGRYIFNQSYSPNGKKVAFQVNGLGMYVANADGSDMRHIGCLEQAEWLPDNKYLIAVETQDDGQRLTSGKIVAVDVTNLQQTVLVSEDDLIALNPSVSPDGKKVLIDNVNDGAVYLFEIK